MKVNLRGARLNEGLTSRQAAGQIGVSQAILLRAESGLGVRPAHAKKIADFYKCQVTDFMRVDDPDWDGTERRGEAVA